MIYRHTSLKKQRGQTLLEILIALGASVFVLSAITVVVISSLSGTQFTKNQNLAKQYAQEGIEVVRRIRDSGGWTGFSTLNGRYCLSAGSTLLPSASPPCTTRNVGGVFVREIQIVAGNCPSGGGPNGSTVTSTVSWADGKCTGNTYCHKVQLATCLHNVNFKAAP